jgi:hypothetical protein
MPDALGSGTLPQYVYEFLPEAWLPSQNPKGSARRYLTKDVSVDESFGDIDTTSLEAIREVLHEDPFVEPSEFDEAINPLNPPWNFPTVSPHQVPLPCGGASVAITHSITLRKIFPFRSS